jgi:enamine deaminase RidA (YjgF/YER057c/UK114 family)
MKRTIFNPKTIGRPIAPYSHAIIVEARRLMFIAGQVAVDKKGKPVGEGDFHRQVAQVFANLEGVLKGAKASFNHVVQFTTFLVDSRDIPAFMEARNKLFKKIYPKGDYPPNTLLVIDRLAREDFLLEVEAIAALD